MFAYRLFHFVFWPYFFSMAGHHLHKVSRYFAEMPTEKFLARLVKSRAHGALWLLLEMPWRQDERLLHRVLWLPQRLLGWPVLILMLLWWRTKIGSVIKIVLLLVLITTRSSRNRWLIRVLMGECWLRRLGWSSVFGLLSTQILMGGMLLVDFVYARVMLIRYAFIIIVLPSLAFFGCFLPPFYRFLTCVICFLSYRMNWRACWALMRLLGLRSWSGSVLKFVSWMRRTRGLKIPLRIWLKEKDVSAIRIFDFMSEKYELITECDSLGVTLKILEFEIIGL